MSTFLRRTFFSASVYFRRMRFSSFFSKNSFFVSYAGAFFVEKKISDRYYSPNRKMEFQILIAGGSEFAKERGIFSSCEILNLRQSTEGLQFLSSSIEFPSLNLPRRGANCVLSKIADRSHRIWVIGGCTELLSENSTTTLIRHEKSGEYLDLIIDDDGERKLKTGNGDGWRLVADLLNIGRSCFSSNLLLDDESRNTNSLLAFGGWNGTDCLRSMEYVSLSKKVVDECNKISTTQIRNEAVDFTCNKAKLTTTTPNSTSSSSSGTTTTRTTENGGEDECMSTTADLISPIKNGCTLVVTNERRRKLADDGASTGDLLLVGGWDGKRTLNTIFRYTLLSPSSDNNVDEDESSCVASFDSSPKLDRLLPYAVECHTTNLVDDRFIYIVGGFDGFRVLDSIIRIDLRNDSVEVIPTKLTTARECHCAEVISIRGASDSSAKKIEDEHFLVVIGGWDGYSALRSIEIFRIIDRSPYLLSVSVTDHALVYARNRACSVLLPN